MIGREVGRYRILDKLGEGGMGEIYLAQDTSLDRKVAVKLLPEVLYRDPVAHKRFLREARSAAALDHPYICKVFEVGRTDDGRDFIAMEFVEGETLDTRLARGPLSVKETLKLGVELAEALDSAHGKGIIHRDLKPGNIMVTPTGHAKIMDFGLAKKVMSDGRSDQDISSALTLEGATLGTLSYMSPEQVRGKTVDGRSDIFSLGIVMYEMLAGIHPFRRERAAATAGAILNDEPPPLGRYVSGLPELLQHTVEKMLAKNPEERYQSVHEVLTNLSRMREDSGKVRHAPGDGAAGPPWAWMGVGVAAGLALGLSVAWAVWSQAESPGGRDPSMRFSIPLPEGELLASGLNFRHAVAVSPDGRWLAYGSYKPGEGEQSDGDPIINLRRVDQSEVRRIPGYNPFFSPDSLHLGFMTRESDGICSLRRTPVEGGLGERIVEFPSDLGFGCTWLPNGMIVFAPRERGGLYAVPSAGGQARPLTRLDTDHDEFSHRLPTALPGSNTLLYTVVRYEGNPDWETSRISALNLDSGATKVLLEGGSDCRFADSGHLLFARQGSLMAVGFNPRELEVMDEPVPVAQGMVHGTNVGYSFSETGAAQYGFSRAGLLLIAPGSIHPEPGRQIVWADGKGRETRLEVEPRRWVSARISADGSQVLISSSTHPRAIWLFELERRTVLRQTFTGNPLIAVWGPDPNVFTMMAGPRGPMGIWTKPANSGTDPGSKLALGPGPRSAVTAYPSSWSPDGRWLAFVSVSPETAHDIWIFDRQGSSFPFQQTTYRERYPEFSPDGRWLAYTSDESGRNEVYVRPFPAPGAPVQVSTGGGEEPCWSKEGTLIFYSYAEPGETERSYSSVRIETAGGSMKPGLPRRLFEAHSAFASPVRSYDVAPDGRFLLIKTDPDLGARRRKALAPSQLEVVTNWFSELKAKVPVE